MIPLIPLQPRQVALAFAWLALCAAGAPLDAAAPGTVPHATQAAEAAALPSPGQATYTVFFRGERIGSEDVSIARLPGGVTISGTSRLAPPVNLTVRRAIVRYDSDGRPQELTMDGHLRDQAIDIKTTFDGMSATSHALIRGVYQDKTDPVVADAVVLPNNFYGAYAALAPRLVRASTGAVLQVYVAPQAQVDLRVGAITTTTIKTPARTFGVRQHQVTFQNPGGPLGADIWTETDGRFVRLTIASAGLDVVRDDVASVSAREQTSHRDGDEDVRIPAAGFALAGTLSKPAAVPPLPGVRAGRSPAVVLVAGSGPVDRDEVVGGIAIFGQLSSALADAGFVVLRYDKRGVGLSGGRPEAATLTDFADDARAVVAFLRDRKDVDGDRIALVGHSEGGWAAMLAASRDGHVWRVAMLASPAVTGAELVLQQQEHLLARSSMSDTDKTARVDLQKKIHQAVLTGKGWEDVPADLRKQADTPWFASFLAFDPAAVLPKLRQPILVVQGERDRQVPAEQAGRLVELTRKRKSGGAAKLVMIPGVNHLFVPATTGEVDEYGSLTEKTIAPQLAAAIVDWLKG